MSAITFDGKAYLRIFPLGESHLEPYNFRLQTDNSGKTFVNKNLR